MEFNLLKNPIIIGIFAAVLTYGYLYWDSEQKYKKNPKIDKKKINIFTPGIVGIIVWFIMSSYTDNKLNNSQSAGNKNILNEVTNISSNSYKYIGRNKIRLPPTDVFLDIARF